MHDVRERTSLACGIDISEKEKRLRIEVLG